MASLGIFLLLPAPAQTPGVPQNGPLVKVTTHLVQVNVVVHGKKNEPIDDLAKEAFTLYDNKQPQQIATFSIESVKAAEESASKTRRPAFDRQEKKAAFQEALWSPLESTTLGLTLRVAPNAPKPGKLRVVMVVDAKNIQLGQKDDRWTGTLEILFVEQGAADRQPMVIGDAMAVNLKKDTYTAALQRGLVLAKDLEMADAGYQLKVAVRDANSGNIGTGHRQNAGTRYPSKITWAMPSSAVWVMESEIEVTPIFPAMRSASP